MSTTKPEAGLGGEVHEQLSEKVARYVRERIMLGELNAPSFLRTEQLAEQLGVSHTPVREALMILQSEGTLRWEPRRGYRINSISRQDIQDLFSVQAYLAGELAARAATTLQPAGIERLRALQARLEDEARAGRFDEVDRLNYDIHRIINAASGSARMAELLRQIVRYVPLGSYGEIGGWGDASVHEHTAVLDALEQRDPDAAREAMAEHIRHVGELLVAYLDRSA